MKYHISERTLDPQPVFVVRRRIKRADIARVLGEMLGAVSLHAQRAGAAIAGQPLPAISISGPA